MRTTEARKLLGMKSSAFYNLKNRLHINSELGFITDEDFELMKKQHAIDVENTTPKVYYRISVNEGYGYYVMHAGLSKKQALRIASEYRKTGVEVLVRACK